MPKCLFDKNKLEELTLSNVKIEDAVLKAEENSAPYLAVNVSEAEVRQAVEKWVEANMIGKSNPGVAQFASSGDSLSYRFKLTRKTEVINQVGEDARDLLEDGAIITMVASAYTYNNSYGSGTGQKLLAVMIHKTGENINKKAAQRLLDMEHQDAEDEDVPNDISEDSNNNEINVDEIPF